ncbi:MAG: transaldolase [Opitutales bacterium]|nr:transaldolase [Opitutales bacterium]
MNTELLPQNQLDQLKQWTTIVADTGDIQSIIKHKPQDSTTNPTLIYKAVESHKYNELLEQAIAENEGKGLHAGEGLIDSIIDSLLVAFGVEILKHIPGRVSTEVNARLSFDTAGTMTKAKHIIDLYEQKGVPRNRVLIKIASTWEGIEAARALEKEGIHCNMTLLFCLAQAVACAEAGAQLISPFVGRITDWYQEKTGTKYSPEQDPGVASVKNIYAYYKKFGHRTEIMGASFRNHGQIQQLAGCDLLTISPDLLSQLNADKSPLERSLTEKEAQSSSLQKLAITEESFRWHLNADPMATEKLADGIRRFDADTASLAQLIRTELISN